MTDTGPVITWEPTTQRHPVLCNVCGTHTGQGYARRVEQGAGWGQHRFVCSTCASGVYDHMAHEAVPLGWTRREALVCARLIRLLTRHLATVNYQKEPGWHVEISAGGETVARLDDLLAVAQYLKSTREADDAARRAP